MNNDNNQKDMIIPGELFDEILPLVVNWVLDQEKQILKLGTPLPEPFVQDAILAGVKKPERIRIRKVNSIPRPTHPKLLNAIRMTGLLGPDTVGITMRYGVCILSSWAFDRGLLIHEFVHVAQWEKNPDTREFLRGYLMQCLTYGYGEAELELEADRITEQILMEYP